MSTESGSSTSQPPNKNGNISDEFDALTLTDAARQQMVLDELSADGLKGGSEGDRPESGFPGLPNQRDVAHHSFFGRRGHIQSTKSTTGLWSQHNDFVESRVVPWIIPLSTQDLLRLLNGFVPIEMEDKWFIYSDGPIFCPGQPSNKVNAYAKTHFHRSWTGEKVAVLNLDISWGEDNASGLWAGKITNLTYEIDSKSCCPPEEDDPDDPEQVAKFNVLEACRWVLGIQLHSDEQLKEPKCWQKLARISAKSAPIAQTTYKGTAISQETMEDMTRLGPGATILFS